MRAISSDPQRVDAEWRDLLRGPGRAARRRAGRGARCLVGAQRRAGRSAQLDPETLPSRPAATSSGNGKANGAQPRRSASNDRGRDPRRRARHLARPHADPRLPHPRPSRGRPRSAGPDQREHASRARSRDLRLHATPIWTGRSSIFVSLGLEIGDPAPDHGPPAQDLLRHDRRRVHAHLTIPTRRPGSRSASRHDRATTPTSPSRAAARS